MERLFYSEHTFNDNRPAGILCLNAEAFSFSLACTMASSRRPSPDYVEAAKNLVRNLAMGYQIDIPVRDGMVTCRKATVEDIKKYEDAMQNPESYSSKKTPLIESAIYEKNLATQIAHCPAHLLELDKRMGHRLFFHNAPGARQYRLLKLQNARLYGTSAATEAIISEI